MPCQNPNCCKNKSLVPTNYSVVKQHWAAKYRFWIRWKLVSERGKLSTNPYEMYIPWWAWPLELVYRLCFGNPKIEKDI